ncbi:MAG: hypothetical protein ACKV2T_40115 [Kofleriaceae bacterium]
MAERLALGEPLGEHAEHATSCERCRELATMATQLGATYGSRSTPSRSTPSGSTHAIDPGLGFTARMTVGAQQRIVDRRRRRIATTVGVSAAAAAAFMFVVTRPREPKPEPVIAISPLPAEAEPPVPVDDADLAFLASDPEAAARTTADWKHITKPLRPYKNLLQGIR